jgi:hypothetical protein
MKAPLWLSDGKKCTASACRHPQPCARRGAEYKPGMWIADFSVPAGAHVADCTAPLWRMHVPYSAAVQPTEPKQAREWVGR